MSEKVAVSDMVFSANEWLRYTRHLQLPQFGIAGQQKLKNAKVLIVGAGGLGSPVSLYLAAAGVGQLDLIDGDIVDLTNLQRQIVFTEDQVGQFKAECAKQRLLALNSDIQVNAITEHLTVNNANVLIDKVDLVLDCTDNFATRYLINDVCVRLLKPWIFASIYQFSGQCTLFTPDTACFRCLFPEPPKEAADCNNAGVLGILPGLLGTLQANEAIKYLAGLGSTLANQLLIIEAMGVDTSKITLAKNPECPVCSVKKYTIDSRQYQMTCETSPQADEISAKLFSDLLPSLLSDDNSGKNFILIDVRTKAERRAFHLGGQHIALDQLQEQIYMLPKNKQILCYCQTGIRSRAAVKQLLQLNYAAKSLQGGIVEYLKLAQAVE